MCNFEGRERVTDEWIAMAVLLVARMEKGVSLYPLLLYFIAIAFNYLLGFHQKYHTNRQNHLIYSEMHNLA